MTATDSVDRHAIGLDDFAYMFPTGLKWAKDMTRDELLVVIRSMRHEREYARTAFMDMAELARGRAKA